LKINKMLEPVAANGIRTVDITSIQGRAEEFMAVADLTNNKRKVAKITNASFSVQEITSNINNRGKSTITGNNRGAFVTQGGDCSQSRILYLHYDNLAEIDACIKSRQTKCSDNGREDISFIAEKNAVWSLVNQKNAYLFQLNAPANLAKSLSDKKSTSKSNIRNWNQVTPSLSCSSGDLLGTQISIDLIDNLSNIQLSLDSSVVPPELAVSFERTNNINCNIEGYLYSVNGNFIQRVKDQNNQDVNLPSVPCSDLGFDRVLFDGEFVLLRYETTKINLQSVFPNQSL